VFFFVVGHLFHFGVIGFKKHLVGAARSFQSA